MPPSTDWRENIADDEETRFAGYARAFAEAQQRKSRKYGSGRALHRKQLAALRARFEVLDDLPDHARHGLFATPGSFPAWVRLSNGGADKLADARPDIRGFSFKVFGPSGPAALGGTAATQDFLLINHAAFSFATADEFVNLALAAIAGPAKLLRYLAGRYGLFGALRQIKKLAGTVGKPFSGYATEPFYSAAPFACGPFAARARLQPASLDKRPEARNDWGGDFHQRVAGGSLQFDFQLQFFVDEALTPIENPTVDWPEAVAPYLTVGRLVVMQQDIDPAFAREVETGRFDIWGGLAAHRPLGEIMRARKAAYFASQQGRT
ncbi:MAG: catalase [Proteobacteria bacterium]|nr:catalase [Pseudomonadota bacterium]